MKKGMATMFLTALMISALPAFAADESTQEFTYAVGGNSVYLSGDVQTNEDSNVFWGFYDNGVLIKLDKHSSNEAFDNVKVTLPYMPDKLEVKSFVWTADGKMSPLTVYETPDNIGSAVTIKTNLISEDENCSYSMYTSRTIPVLISEDLTAIKYYRLDETLRLNINGTYVHYIDDDVMAEYLLANPYPEVELVDTDGNGDYDYISTMFYSDAVVDYTLKTEYNRIGFKAYGYNISSRLQYDPDDADITINITKDGKPISFDEIKENDVLSIAYDVESGFMSSDFYNIIVSNDTVEGTVTERNSMDNTVSVNGTEYKLCYTVSAEDLELSGQYKFYLNAFGDIAYYEEMDIGKNIGILTGMYQSVGSDYPTIRFIDANGNITEMECYDIDAANEFYSLATDSYGSIYNYESISLEDIADNIQNMVFEYTISNNRIRFKSQLAPRGDEDLIYHESSHRLGSYTLTPDVTKMLYLDDYINDGGNVYSIKTDNLVDNCSYSAYVYDRNSNNDYRLCIVLNGLGSISANTSIAVVNSSPVLSVFNGENYISFDVLKDGIEQTIRVEEGTGAEDISIGDIVIYSENLDNTISNFQIVMSAAQDYDSMFDYNNVPQFSEVIQTINDDNQWLWSTHSNPSEAYFGPVYSKNGNVLEMFVASIDGKSSPLYDTMTFNIEGAQTYVYDYNKTKTYRVSSAQLPDMTSKIYNLSDEFYVDWYEMQKKPSFAFIRTLNDETKEVVLFNAPINGDDYFENERSIEININDIPVAENASYGMYFNKIIPEYRVDEYDGQRYIAKYHLADDFELYINGISVEPSDAIMTQYILGDQSGAGTVTLEKTDDDYFFDKVYISNYTTAVVDSIDGNEIYFKSASDGNNSIILNESAELNITKNGEPIGLQDISKNDAINISYDITMSPSESSFYNIIVSDKKITCTLDDIIYEYNNTVTINGESYWIASYMDYFAKLDFDTEYTFIVDSFNTLIDVEDVDFTDHFGIMTGMNPSENGGYAEITFIKDDGSIEVMNAASHEDENNFYRMATGSYDAEYADQIITKEDLRDNIQNTVFTYSVADNTVKFIDNSLAYGGSDMEYDSLTNRLGSYSINDRDTAMLDLTYYFDGGEPVKIDSSSLNDGNTYTAFVYRTDYSMTYKLCIFTDPTIYISAETSVAVVQSEPEFSESDNLIYLTVAKDNMEEITICAKSGSEAESAEEGDIVIYSVDYDGTVKDFNIVLESEKDYNSMFDKAVNGFSSNIKTIYEDNLWYWSSAETSAYAYFGPVYSCSNNTIELITSAADGQSNILSDTELFDIQNANKYVYDYSIAANNRVSCTAIPYMSLSIYSTAFADSEKSIIDWMWAANEEIPVNFAFIKETDDIVTDVVIFLAD